MMQSRVTVSHELSNLLKMFLRVFFIIKNISIRKTHMYILGSINVLATFEALMNNFNKLYG